jgi:hypothetical protein
VLNGLFRQRNFMYLFGRIAIIGAHNKTSASTGSDKTTLHFLPPAFERLLYVYYHFVATHETYLIEHVLEIHDHGYLCHFLSGNGARWTPGHETTVLKSATKTVASPPLGKAALRQILPGVAEHYCIGVHSSTVGNSVLHSQMGHSDNLGQRLYARTADTHKQLTNQFCHDSLDFCNSWAELWGFDTKIPSLEKALMRQNTFEELQTGSWATSNAMDIANQLDQLTALVKYLVTHTATSGIESMYGSVAQPGSRVMTTSNDSLLFGSTVPSRGLAVMTKSGASSFHGSTHSLKRSAQAAFSEEEHDSTMVSNIFCA